MTKSELTLTNGVPTFLQDLIEGRHSEADGGRTTTSVSSAVLSVSLPWHDARGSVPSLKLGCLETADP